MLPKTLGDDYMTVKTVTDQKAGVIVRTVIGDLTLEEFKSSFDAALTHPDFQKNMPVIWDFRNADLSKIFKQDLDQIANHIKSHAENRGANFRVALVASRDLEYGVLRMYEAIGYDLPLHIRVFRRFEEAKEWASESD